MSTPVSHTSLGRTLSYDGGWERARAVEVPVEAPLNLIYANVPYAVMMVTPGNLDDFALGFSLTEGIIRSVDEVRSVRIDEVAGGLAAHIDLVPAVLSRHLARQRTFAGRTSCGICGIESLDQLPRASVGGIGADVPAASIHRALAALDAQQPLHEKTRAVHAAAWCDMTGDILVAREDVGRHNALDKMIGAALRAGHSPAQGFAVITSRCSYEMVEKAAIFGARTLIAISAPTSLAIERAAALGMSLICVARRDSAIDFSLVPRQETGTI